MDLSGQRKMKINRLDVKAIQENNGKGCISKTLLECLEELQNLHNDYPLVPEKTEIKELVLSICIKYVLQY